MGAHELEGEIVVSARRLRLRSAFALGYCAVAMVSVPFGVLMGLIGLFGGSGVAVNGQPTYGPAALIAGVVLGFAFPLGTAFFVTIGALLLRIPLPFVPRLRFRPAARSADGHGTVSETT